MSKKIEIKDNKEYFLNLKNSLVFCGKIYVDGLNSIEITAFKKYLKENNINYTYDFSCSLLKIK